MANSVANIDPMGLDLEFDAWMKATQTHTSGVAMSAAPQQSLPSSRTQYQVPFGNHAQIHSGSSYQAVPMSPSHTQQLYAGNAYSGAQMEGHVYTLHQNSIPSGHPENSGQAQQALTTSRVQHGEPQPSNSQKGSFAGGYEGSLMVDTSGVMSDYVPTSVRVTMHAMYGGTHGEGQQAQVTAPVHSSSSHATFNQSHTSCVTADSMPPFSHNVASLNMTGSSLAMNSLHQAASVIPSSSDMNVVGSMQPAVSPTNTLHSVLTRAPTPDVLFSRVTSNSTKTGKNSHVMLEPKRNQKRKSASSPRAVVDPESPDAGDHSSRTENNDSEERDSKEKETKRFASMEEGDSSRPMDRKEAQRKMDRERRKRIKVCVESIHKEISADGVPLPRDAGELKSDRASVLQAALNYIIKLKEENQVLKKQKGFPSNDAQAAHSVTQDSVMSLSMGSPRPLFGLVFTCSSVPLIIRTIEGTIVDLNEPFSQVLRVSRDALVGSEMMEVHLDRMAQLGLREFVQRLGNMCTHRQLGAPSPCLSLDCVSCRPKRPARVGEVVEYSRIIPDWDGQFLCLVNKAWFIIDPSTKQPSHICTVITDARRLGTVSNTQPVLGRIRSKRDAMTSMPSSIEELGLKTTDPSPI